MLLVHIYWQLVISERRNQGPTVCISSYLAYYAASLTISQDAKVTTKALLAMIDIMFLSSPLPARKQTVQGGRWTHTKHGWSRGPVATWQYFDGRVWPTATSSPLAHRIMSRTTISYASTLGRFSSLLAVGNPATATAAYVLTLCHLRGDEVTA
jgi:hypothetical protein